MENIGIIMLIWSVHYFLSLLDPRFLQQDIQLSTVIQSAESEVVGTTIIATTYVLLLDPNGRYRRPTNHTPQFGPDRHALRHILT